MTLLWSDLFTTWTWRPAMLVLVVGLLWLYSRGRHFDPLTDISPDSSFDSHNHKFYFSLAVLLFALASPIHIWAQDLFFMQVAQHLLLISLFPALFMGSNPLPTIFNGLPRQWQNRLTPILQRWQPLISKITPKSVCWFFFVATVWLWYDPTLHALTQQSPFLYHFAIATMMSGALLHWWHVTTAAPRLHKPLPGFTHMGYALIGAAPLKIPGLILLFAYLPFYTYSTATFLGFEIDPLLSQRLGGIVVWSLGGIVYSTTAVGFLSKWLSIEEAKPEQPRSVWDNEENFIAPHLE